MVQRDRRGLLGVSTSSTLMSSGPIANAIEVPVWPAGGYAMSSLMTRGGPVSVFVTMRKPLALIRSTALRRSGTLKPM